MNLDELRKNKFQEKFLYLLENVNIINPKLKGVL